MTIMEKSFPRARHDAAQAIFSRVVDFTSAYVKGSPLEQFANLATTTSTYHCRKVDAIVNPRRESSSMIVGESITLDNSVLRLSVNTMDKLLLSHGDTALVVGSLRRETVLVCLLDEDLDDGFVHTNSVVRLILGVTLGDAVAVYPCPGIGYLNRVVVLPLFDDVRNHLGSVFDEYLQPYFDEAYRPLAQGDIFTCKSATRTAAFKVFEIDPPGYGIVSQNTIICWHVDHPRKGDTAGKKSKVIRAFGNYSGITLGRYNLFDSERPPWRAIQGKLRGIGSGRGHYRSLSVEALIPKSGNIQF